MRAAKAPPGSRSRREFSAGPIRGVGLHAVPGGGKSDGVSPLIVILLKNPWAFVSGKSEECTSSADALPPSFSSPARARGRCLLIHEKLHEGFLG